MNRTAVSTILPVFNAERFLRQAIESVLCQKVEVELIVIDDGSTDGSADIARSFGDRVRYIYQDNCGAAAARNRGLKEAGGEYLAFIDADDLWPEDKLAWQLEVLVSQPHVDVVIGKVKLLLDGPVTEPGIGRSEGCYSEAFYCYLFGSILIRTAALQKVGFVDQNLRLAEDVDWFLRMKESGLSIVSSEKLALFYRQRGDSLTAGRNLIERNVLKVIKQSLNRRRSGSGKMVLPALGSPGVHSEASQA